MPASSISDSEPVTLGGAAQGVLTTGVALAAVLFPEIGLAAQVAIIGFGNSLIIFGSILWTRRRTWSLNSVREVAAVAVETGDAGHAVAAVAAK